MLPHSPAPLSWRQPPTWLNRSRLTLLLWPKQHNCWKGGGLEDHFSSYSFRAQQQYMTGSGYPSEAQLTAYSAPQVCCVNLMHRSHSRLCWHFSFLFQENLPHHQVSNGHLMYITSFYWHCAELYGSFPPPPPPNKKRGGGLSLPTKNHTDYTSKAVLNNLEPLEGVRVVIHNCVNAAIDDTNMTDIRLDKSLSNLKYDRSPHSNTV